MNVPSFVSVAPPSSGKVQFSGFGAEESSMKHHEFKHSFNECSMNIVTNLPLQMAIYFNFFYFPFWFLSFLISYITKIDSLEQVYQVTVGACLVAMTLVEIPRLYFGFAGNLKEGISQLAGFWLLTVLIQLPSVCFVLFTSETNSLPFESANHIVYFIFIIAEIIFGLYAIMLMVREQTNRFRIQYLIDELPDPVHYNVDRDGEDDLVEENTR